MKKEYVSKNYKGRLNFWLLVAMILDRDLQQGKLKLKPKKPSAEEEG